MTNTNAGSAGSGEWSGVAAQIEAAIGEPIPPADSAELDDFLSELRVNHPGYADLLEKARPIPEPEQEGDEDDGLLITGKSRLRQARQQAIARMWWRPASFGKLVLNKKRGGPLVLATLALLFGAYTISYFAKPKEKSGGLANGPLNHDSASALDAATNADTGQVKSNPNAAESAEASDLGSVDAATAQSAQDGTLRQTQPQATPLENTPSNMSTQSNMPVETPPPAFTSPPPSEAAQPTTPILIPTPTTSRASGNTPTPTATNRNAFGSTTPAHRQATPRSANGLATTPILLSPIPTGDTGHSTAGAAPGTFGKPPTTITSQGAAAGSTERFGGQAATPRHAGVSYQRSEQPGSGSAAQAMAVTPGVAYARSAAASAGGQATSNQASSNSPVAPPEPNTQPNVPSPVTVPDPPVTQTAGTFGGDDTQAGPPTTEAVPQTIQTTQTAATSAAAPGVMYVANRKQNNAETTRVFYAASDKSKSASAPPPTSTEPAPITTQKELSMTTSSPATQNPAGADPSVGVVVARLITVLEAPLGRPVPAVAESSSGVWVGVAQPNVETGRMEVTFSRLIRGNDSYQVNALAYDTSYQLGLPGTVNDRSPAILQDVFRATLNGLNTYAQGLTEAGTTTIAGNTVVATQSAPALGTVLAGQLGQLFQLPKETTSVIRTLRVERETAVYIMTGVGSVGTQR